MRLFCRFYSFTTCHVLYATVVLLMALYKCDYYSYYYNNYYNYNHQWIHLNLEITDVSFLCTAIPCVCLFFKCIFILFFNMELYTVCVLGSFVWNVIDWLNNTVLAASILVVWCEVLTFGPGVSRQTISVTILDSNVPKPDRQFEIRLDNPSEGLLLASPDTGQ